MEGMLVVRADQQRLRCEDQRERCLLVLMYVFFMRFAPAGLDDSLPHAKLINSHSQYEIYFGLVCFWIPR